MRARSFRPAAALIPFATLTVALQAAAQQHPMPAQAPAMQQCMDMMGGPPAALLLEHREALSLSADQVSRLEAISDRTQAIGAEHMQPVRAAHMRAVELLRADSPDFDEYEDALEEAAEHMVEAHVAVVRASVEARQVLTAEQRATLQTLRPMHTMPPGADAAMPRMPARPDSAGPPRMDAGQPRAGMSDMQHMHQMMMMHCMMMGAEEHQGGHDG